MTARHRFEWAQRVRIAKRILHDLTLINRGHRQSKPIAIIRARGIGCRLVLP